MKELESIIFKNLEIKNRSCRLFHGRGKLILGFESFTIDLFSHTILVTLFNEMPADIFIKIEEILHKLPAENILVQKRFLHRPTLEVLKGKIVENEMAREDDLLYQLKFGNTQNIGFFLDMYLGRLFLIENSSGKKILNLFSYTCSLSIAALKGGALQVTNVDMSKAALAVGESNHQLNNVLVKQKVRFLPFDILKSWKKIFQFGPYDTIIIDPPTNQGDSFKVDRDYYKIIKRLDEGTSKNASVMACLNSPHLKSQFLIDLFNEHAPQFKLEKIIYSAFSEMEIDQEAGLKILIFIKI